MDGSIFGFDVFVSDALPIPPTDAQIARRIVRHGLADVLEWLGEDVGPAPQAQTHVLMLGTAVHASAAIVNKLKEA